MNRTRKKWSRAEKKMLFISVGAIVFLALVGGVWNWLNATPNVNVPTPKMPRPNAFDNYVRAGKMLVAPAPLFGSYDNPKTKDRYAVPLAAKKRWLKRNVGTMRVLRQGFQYRYLYPPSRSLFDLNPQRARFRELARLMAAESEVCAAHGDWKGATQSALDVIRFGTDIPHGAPLVCWTTGKDIELMGRDELWKSLPYLNATIALSTARRLEELAARRISFVESLQEEKWSVQGGLLKAMKENRWNQQFLGTEVPDWQLNFVNNRLVMRHYTEIMDAQIAAARQSYAAPRKPLPELRASLADPFAAFLTPNFSNINWAMARRRTDHNLLLTTMALRAYHLDKGRYPVRLSQLVPAYLSKLPDDPFALHQTLRYKLVPVRYIREVIFVNNHKSPPNAPADGDYVLHFAQTDYCLYSVGPDLKDNGGRPQHDKNEATSTADLEKYYRVKRERKGDIVAGINR